MFWVVDGTRTSGDYYNFYSGKDYKLNKTIHPGIFHINNPSDSFPILWTKSPVPVIFDFLGSQVPSINQPDQNLLWCLFPDRVEGSAVVAALLREDFIYIVKTNPKLLATAHNFTNYLNDIQQKKIDAEKAEMARINEHQRKMGPKRHFRF